jgi:hypothetical protein
LRDTPLQAVGPPYTAAREGSHRGPAGRMRRCLPPRPVGGVSRVRRDWPRLRTTRTGKAQGGTASAGWPSSRGDGQELRTVITYPSSGGDPSVLRPTYAPPGKGSPFRAGQLAQTAVTDVVLA